MYDKGFYLEVHFHSLAEFQAFCLLVSGATLTPEQADAIQKAISNLNTSTDELAHAEQTDAGQVHPAL